MSNGRQTHKHPSALHGELTFSKYRCWSAANSIYYTKGNGSRTSSSALMSSRIFSVMCYEAMVKGMTFSQVNNLKNGNQSDVFRGIYIIERT